jgi:predicted phosphodiesterase
MKIHLLSDLHLEFEDHTPLRKGIDAVVLAGDIHVGTKGIEWALRNYPNIPIIYVLGNHEYYRGAYPRLLEKMEEANYPKNLHILENGSVTIEHVRFLGCTLWADFDLMGEGYSAALVAQARMNDYKLIRKSPEFRLLKASDTRKIHEESDWWLRQTLAAPEEGKVDFVVTHHGPSMQSVPHRYKDDVISCAYSSNLEDVIMEHQPAYWVHGHTHDSMDYQIGDTRVLCNPKGYRGTNSQFNPELIIEL